MRENRWDTVVTWNWNAWFIPLSVYFTWRYCEAHRTLTRRMWFYVRRIAIDLLRYAPAHADSRLAHQPNGMATLYGAIRDTLHDDLQTHRRESDDLGAIFNQ